ncbi:MAG: low molecular weight phosphotyrosine protein phosphatase [Parachlamydiaceae bacterium]|nr:low molecular weight phosphotyrosine protein phosphatase [Parachlamydiaceae bacterium]
MTSVLFVCLGNICRSPAAEGILRHMVSQNSSLKDLEIQSCGLGSWHAGNLPDLRMQEAAKKRGVTLTSRAQAITPEFFNRFDYILAADHEVLKTLQKHAHQPEHKAKLYLMTAFSQGYTNEEVPDPYYGGEAGFELVLDMLEDACEGFLSHIKKSKKS